MKQRSRSLAAFSLSMMLTLSPLASLAEEYTVNFNDTDINELIRFVADATGETFLIDPRCEARFNWFPRRPSMTSSSTICF